MRTREVFLNEEIPYLIAFDVGQVFRNGDDGSEDGHESGDEGDLGRPRERRPQGVARRVVHAEVQQKAADGGDRQAGQNRVLLGPDRRDAVDAAEQQSHRIQSEQQRGELGVDDDGADYSGSEYDDPRESLRHFSARHRQEGLVHFVDVLIEDLVDADDEGVAQEERHHPETGPGQVGDPLRVRQRSRRIDQGPGYARDRSEYRPADRVRARELVHGLQSRPDRPGLDLFLRFGQGLGIEVAFDGQEQRRGRRRRRRRRRRRLFSSV